VNWDECERLEVIGVDEIALKKGHRDFVTIVTARSSEQGEIRLLAVLEDRKKDTVKAFFSSIPKRLRKTVRVVCTDLYDGFVNAAREVFGGATRLPRN
jgi:transposase